MTSRPRVPERLWSLRGAVVTGLGLRLVAALTGYGPFASDDYLYVLAPAARWLTDASAHYPSPIRSELLPRAVWGLFEAARALGIEDPTWLVRFTYVGLGLWSLLAIPAAYALTRRRLGEKAALWAAFLVAAGPLMPRISTRALLGVAALPPLLWGLVFVDWALPQDDTPEPHALRRAFVGGLLLGLATLVRFQLGAVVVACALLLAWPRQLSMGAVLSRLGAFAAGSAVALPLQALIDLTSGRLPLETPWRYLTFNLHGSAQFGTSPWYTYLLQLLLYTAPPATLILARPMWSAAKRHAVVLGVLIFYVALHSLIGHKEDRFLFPMLPLLFILVAAALEATWEGTRWQRLGSRFFVAAAVVALVATTLSDGQRNLTTPLGQVAALGSRAKLATVGWKQIPELYLGDAAPALRARTPEALLQKLDAGAQPTHVLWRRAPDASVLRALEARGLRCADAEIFRGDLSDRLLVAVNPRRNGRRLPTTLMHCDSVAPQGAEAD